MFRSCSGVLVFYSLLCLAIACGYDYVLYYIFPFRALQSGLGEALSGMNSNVRRGMALVLFLRFCVAAFSYGVVFPVVAFYIVTGELTTFPLASALPLAILVRLSAWRAAVCAELTAVCRATRLR